MSEDLSLRERPRRHEIDHEMAIRREREATSPRDRSRDGDLAREATSPRDGAWYIVYRTAGGPGLELCDYFIKG